MELSNSDKRIPLKGSIEYDVHTGWRHALCYTDRAGVCRKGKRAYNKRVRKHYKRIIRKDINEV